MLILIRTSAPILILTFLGSCSGCHQGTATAHIRIARTTPEPNPRTLEQVKYRTLLQEQVSLAKSLEVVREALEIPGMSHLPTLKRESNDPVNLLQSRMKVVVSEADESMQISIVADSDEDASYIVRSLAEAYLTKACALERNQTAEHFFKARQEFVGGAAELQRQLVLRKKLGRAASKDASSDRPSAYTLEKARLDREIESQRRLLEKLSEKASQLELDLRAENRFALVFVNAGDPPKVVYQRKELGH